MARFQDKVAVVTGAASGFGEAIAKRFASEGARVVLSDVDDARGEQVTAGITDAGGTARFVHADVSIAADVEALMGAAVESFGGLDILVNNAGFTHRTQPVWELDEAEYDAVFATNTKGVWLGVKYAVPVMRERGGGVIVNTASI
ncbi:MAG: SDR family NAD(P)-dependent oxidoreductase, partial [Pseudomonadales bacterium]